MPGNSAKSLKQENRKTYNWLSGSWGDYVNFRGREESYEFYKQLLKAHGAKKVLDIGGGSGHHAIELAKAGFEMHLCDFSRAMVNKAVENASSAGVKIHTKVADWEELEKAYGSNQFDGAIQTFNSVTLNLNEANLRRNVGSAYAVLRNGGIYAFDARNYEAMQLKTLDDRCTIINNDEILVKARILEFGEPNLIGLLTYHKPSGREGTQFVRAWTPLQLLSILKAAGFTDIRTYHNFRIEPKESRISLPDSVSYIQFAAIKP